MKKATLILFASAFFACGKNADPQIQNENKDSVAAQVKDTTEKIADNNISDEENKVINAVMDLPEMIEEATKMEELTGGKSRLAAMVLETPEENGKGYYVVKVSEDDDMSLVGLYNFNVYYPSMKIMWVNPIEAEEMSLDDWRKQRKEN